jgi:hypothetical protein
VKTYLDRHTDLVTLILIDHCERILLRSSNFLHALRAFHFGTPDSGAGRMIQLRTGSTARGGGRRHVRKRIVRANLRMHLGRTIHNRELDGLLYPLMWRQYRAGTPVAAGSAERTVLLRQSQLRPVHQ